MLAAGTTVFIFCLVFDSGFIVDAYSIKTISYNRYVRSERDCPYRGPIFLDVIEMPGCNINVVFETEGLSANGYFYIYLSTCNSIYFTAICRAELTHAEFTTETNR